MTTASKALDITRDILEQHGFSHWAVEIDKRPRNWRYGCCRYATRTIGLSEFFLAKATDDEITNLILHEVAHVLSPGSHHYKVWKEQYARLLWKHMRELAFAMLRSDQYCERVAESLLDFAKTHEADPILPRLPTPFDRPRGYPWTTTPAYLARWSQIQPIRVIEENTKHYLWMPGDEESATGHVVKSDYETQPFFRTWEDARQSLLKSEVSKLELLKEFKADEFTNRFDQRIEQVQLRIQQLEDMTAPAQSANLN